MAWDFSTEPEFQEHLDWMREFVREEIWPLETLTTSSSRTQLDARPWRRCSEQVKERGLWAAHLDARARRPGLRAGQARPHARGPRHARRSRRSPSAMPGARLRQLRDPRPRRHARAEGALAHPLLAGDLKSAFSMTEPDTAGSDPTLLKTRAVQRRRRLGHQRPQVVLLQRLDRRLPDRHGRHRPRRAHRTSGRRCSSSPSTRPGVDIVRDVADDGAPAGVLRPATAATPRSSTRTCACRRERAARRRRAPASSSPSSGSARGASTTACAGSASRGAPSTCSASARSYARRARRAAGREADRAELDRRLGRGDAGRAADDAARRLEDGHRGRRGGAAARSR